jgi:hypothetical protein
MGGKMERNLCIAILLLMMTIISSVSGGQYGIVLESLPNHDLAEKRAADWQNEGFGPLSLREESGTNVQLLYGRFTWLDEAHWYNKELQKRGYFTSVITLDDELPEEQIPTLLFPFEDIINKTGLDSAPEIELTKDTDNRIAEFVNIRESQGISKAKEKLYQIMNTADVNDPIHGWCLLSLGYLAYSENQKDNSIRLFKQLADGSVSATKKQRVEALQRYAFSLMGKQYREEGDKTLLRLDAAQSFRILLKYKQTPEGRASVLLQIAGIIFELAKESDMSTYEEAK